MSTNSTPISPRGLEGVRLWVPADTVTYELQTKPMRTKKFSKRQLSMVNKASLTSTMQ